MRLAHSPVPCSDDARSDYLNQAIQVNSEIREWLGDDGCQMVGLGQNCNASWYIKASGNKKASYPFDWIVTTPDIIIDILNDDFSKFLKKEMLIPHGIDAGHKRYHETFFGHRNPASRESDREYLLRCVERWKWLMNSQTPVLFLTVVLNEPDKRPRWKKGFTKNFKMPRDQGLSSFDELIQSISVINPNCKFLFLEQFTEGKFELTIKSKAENMMWVKFRSVDKNTGVQYLHKVDDEVMKTLLTHLS